MAAANLYQRKASDALRNALPVEIGVAEVGLALGVTLYGSFVIPGDRLRLVSGNTAAFVIDVAELDLGPRFALLSEGGQLGISFGVGWCRDDSHTRLPALVSTEEDNAHLLARRLPGQAAVIIPQVRDRFAADLGDDVRLFQSGPVGGLARPEADDPDAQRADQPLRIRLAGEFVFEADSHPNWAWRCGSSRDCRRR